MLARRSGALHRQSLSLPRNAWRDRFAAVPFEDKGGSHPSRYYQDIAVERVMAAIAENRPRILLTLATGTGKTFIAFQVAWKLFHSRWNLGREPSRRPRILFLADRNILADQAYNAFSAFPEDAMVRIAPEDIRKKGKVPKNGSLFFTIFQTFMSGPPKDGQPSPYFGEYPPDFFDFVIVDECHRGGATDESDWRGILDYFAPAVQLGLTATPKRRDNVDTYAYFGDPVYIGCSTATPSPMRWPIWVGRRSSGTSSRGSRSTSIWRKPSLDLRRSTGSGDRPLPCG
jgi:type I restriction enzyme R subunit